MSVETVTSPVRMPFKGLTPFDDSDVDARLFFGRERETEIVVANIIASRLTVLYGPSGVGKSSLLRAGVAQSLRRLGGSEPLAVAVFSTWSGDPVAGIEEAARSGIADALGADPGEAPGSTADRLDAWTAALGGELCLILDQLEEYFLYSRDGTAGDDFAWELAELVTRPRLKVNVLLGIRDDALAQLDAFKEQLPGLFSNSLRLDRLDRNEARSTVLGPLAWYNELAPEAAQMSIEPPLVEVVLDEVATGRIETGVSGRGGVADAADLHRIEAPYLQLVLQRLWEVERERGSGVLRLATFRELGGAQRIVEDHLERAMAALTPPQQEVAAGMFDHLVTPSGTKIAHGVADLASYAHVGERELAPVLNVLASQRILRPLGEDGVAAGDRYEIFHDVLADAVLAWRTRHESDVALAHERAESRRRQRRLAAVAGAALLALAVMAVMTAYAFSQRSEAREQTGRARAAQQRAVDALAVAKTERDRANREAKSAKAAKKDADASRATSERSAEQSKRDAKRAEASEADAEASEAQATRLAEDLAQERDNAVRLQRRAERSAAVATKEKRNAQTQTRRARRSEKNAVAAKQATQRALRTTQAQALTSRALSLLTTDPDQSLRLAVGSAGIAPTAELERATRNALLSSRARAILPAGPGAVVAAGVSADGRLLLAAGAGGEARVYRTVDRERVARLRHGGPIAASALAADGSSVATAGRDGVIQVWSVRRRARFLRLAHGAPVRMVAFSPDGSLLAAAGSDGRISVWNRDGGLVHRITLRGDVDDVAFGPGGALLAVAGNALLYDAATGALRAEFDQPGDIRDAALSPDGALLATGGRDDLAFVWDARTGARLRPLPGHGSDVIAVAWSPDGQYVATGSADSGARVFLAGSGALLSLLARHVNHVTTVAFSSDGAALVSGSEDGTGTIWSGPFYSRGAPLLGHDGAVTRVSFTADGLRAITGGEDGSVRLWTGRADPELRGRAKHSAAARAVAVSPDGRLLVTTGLDRTAVIRRRNAAPVRALPHPAAVNDAAFSPDGTLLLTGGEDGVAYLRRVADGRLVRSFSHFAPVRAVAFGPDGSRIATAGSDGIAAVWRTADSRVPLRLLRHGGGPLNGVAISPDGRAIATAGSDGDARVWRLANGRLLEKLDGHTAAVSSVAYSPDGRLLLTSSVDSDLRLWDARTLTLRRTVRGHSFAVSDAVFSPDGRWIASAGATTVGLWETQTGRRLPPSGPLVFLRGHPERIRAVAFAPDGRISSVGDDGSLRTWDCTICVRRAALVRLAKLRLASLRQSLTPVERQRYLGVR